MSQPIILQDEVLSALKRVRDPDLGRDIVSLGFIKDLQVSADTVSCTLELTTPACPAKEILKEEARRAILSIPGIKNVHITMTAQVRPSRLDRKEKLIPQVANIIPVASGKGGVGKSTVSANLALALAQLGARVGLMDADVYGPSIPLILGAHEPPLQQGGRVLPPTVHGVKVLSMGFFLPPGEAVIWRGPMLHKTMEQFLSTFEWGELDYLILDLPPGTGDIHLSLCQMIPLTGAVVVSTPQDVALKVAEKAILMFQKLHTPILGLVENMSGFLCPHCHARVDIFGKGGAQRYGREKGIPFLGEIPLSVDIRQTSDEGHPIVQSAPDSASAQAFLSVARNLAAQVSIHTFGEGKEAASRGEPVKVTQPSKTEIKIRWKDGHESLYTGQLLRGHCPCAECVEETSGVRRLKPESVPPDVHPLSLNPVGRYAYHFQWSDGHRSGIYAFEYLRGLCPCPACAQTAYTQRK